MSIIAKEDHSVICKSQNAFRGGLIKHSNPETTCYSEDSRMLTVYQMEVTQLLPFHMAVSVRRPQFLLHICHKNLTTPGKLFSSKILPIFKINAIVLHGGFQSVFESLFNDSGQEIENERHDC
ncbi:hypothetical protein BsWGS_18613 [Bradybaena similaris]